MQATCKLKNGTLMVSNIKTEDGNDKCHFAFDISLTMPTVSFCYNFGEVVFFRMYEFCEQKSNKLIDENSMENFVKISKEYIAICVKQDGVDSNIKLELDNIEDQDKLADFLIELKAVCEVLMG